jgi:hypothetical protein
MAFSELAQGAGIVWEAEAEHAPRRRKKNGEEKKGEEKKRIPGPRVVASYGA